MANAIVDTKLRGEERSTTLAWLGDGANRAGVNPLVKNPCWKPSHAPHVTGTCQNTDPLLP